jgi:Nucleoporin Nup120/160
MASSFTLVGTHITSVIPTARDNTINISSSRKDSSAISENAQPSDVLPEHATEAFVFYDPQIHILLRVLHGRRTVELVSLSIDVPPIRFTFSSPLIPSPAVIFDDPEIHIIACTVSGSVYRLVFPLPYLWSSHYLTEDWRSEYLLKHPVDNLLGPVHVKEAGGVFIALKDGGILNLDAIRRPNDSKFLGMDGRLSSSSSGN